MGYFPNHQAGANLLPLAESLDILTLGHVFRILTCNDLLVQETAWTCVRYVVKCRIDNEPGERMFAK